LISTADFRKGLTIELEGEIFQILDFQHVKPGKGQAFVRTKLRNAITGNVFDRTFKAGEHVQDAYLERRPVQFLYSTGDELVFMDTETFDQTSVPGDEIAEARNYLKQGLEVQFVVHNGRRIGIELPDTVGLKVAQTDPGLRGDTASGGSKPATLETGTVVQVPLFINEGDVVRVDTRTGIYVERI
jgi:elongation factor P